MLHKSDLEEDIAAYIKDRVPQAAMHTMLDVGANVGWVTGQFLNSYPDLRAWAFEPVSSIYEALIANLSRFPHLKPFPRTQCVRAALGDKSGTGLITSLPDVTVNHLVEEPSDWPVEEIQIYTGDEFCASEGITEVNYLKVDAEGRDMQVIQGFSRMLSTNSIHFVQVEAAISASNNIHVPAREFCSHLGRFGYELFRVTNQASFEYPLLARADLVFISGGAAKAYKYG